ncbi:MAG: hypothetical protein WKF92_12815 [Pyrinomonadaceae bacterium]
MIKKFAVFLLLFFVLFETSVSAVVAKDFGILKRTLPEFRDISIWKGRTGLTLFSPDGRYLAVSGKSADVVIYDIETGDIKSKIDGSGFRAFSFSPDAKFAIAQNTADLAMQVFDIETGKSVREIRGIGKLSNITKILGGTGFINEINGIFPTLVLEMGRVPVTKNWKNILVNKNDKEFSIFDFETGNLKFELKHENFNSGWESAKLAISILGALGGAPVGGMLMGSASNAQFSGNGKYLLIANGNKKPTLWNIESGNLISKFDAGERVFYSKFSPDETMVATSDFRGVTKIWNTETGELISSIGGKKERGVIAGWTQSGNKVLIIPMGKGDLRAYDPKTGALAHGFEKSTPYGTVLSANSRFLVTTPRKNKAVLFHIWETETGKLLATVPKAKKQDMVWSIKWSPNQDMIATSGGLKKEINIWNIKGEHLQTLSNSTMPMQFSDDGRYLATGGTVANSKVDIGYIWEFPLDPIEERLGMLSK